MNAGDREGRLEIRWPDAAAERVRAAVGRITRAGPALRARALPDRIAAVARVLGDFARPDSEWRRELAESFAAASPFTPGTVAEGLTSALTAWHPETFVAAAQRELASVLGDAASTPPRAALTPFEWTAVLAGGTIPMPTLLSALLPLVVGSPVLLRESAKDSVTGNLLARALTARDAGLADAFGHVALDWEEPGALDALLEAPCIVATGSDETMRAIAARLSPRQRFVAYGHRVSIVVLGRASAAALPDLARAIALDVARWDQTGCLSPIAVLAVAFEPAEADALARAIAGALDAISPSMPRGEPPIAARTLLAAERAQARMRAAGGRALVLEGRDSTVVLEADASPRPAPLYRFLRVLPVDSVESLPLALADLAAPLSNVALAGFDALERERVVSSVTRFGASRLTCPGRLQTPPVDWPRDGLPLLTPLARFVQAERDGTE